MYKAGNKLICKNTINNIMGDPLFIKGCVYTILSADYDDEKLILDHILYGNEYGEFDFDFVEDNFVYEN